MHLMMLNYALKYVYTDPYICTEKAKEDNALKC